MADFIQRSQVQIARAAYLGLTTGPPDHLTARAATEGWIHLPRDRGSLAQLAG